jgi:hypothetical protein
MVKIQASLLISIFEMPIFVVVGWMFTRYGCAKWRAVSNTQEQQKPDKIILVYMDEVSVLLLCRRYLYSERVL